MKTTIRRILFIALSLTLMCVFLSGVTVSATETEEMASMALGDAITVTVQAGESISYKFTPTEDGEYAFCSEDGTANCKIYIIDRDYTYYGLPAELKIGNECILTVDNYEDTEQTYTLRLEKTVPVERVEITVETTRERESIYKGDKFTLRAKTYPAWARREKWTWTCSNETVASIKGSGNYRGVTALAEGSAVITVTMESGAQASYPLTVVKPEEIDCGDSKTLTLKWDDVNSIFDNEKYIFTPDISGEYVFYTPREWIEMEEQGHGFLGIAFSLAIYHNEEEIQNDISGSSDYSGDYKAVSAAMEAGETYILEVGCTLQTRTETVYLEKVERPNAITIVNDNGTIFEGYFFNLSCEAESCMPFMLGDVSWSISDENVVVLEYARGEFAEFSAVGSGSTTITAELDNGVSATYEINVAAYPTEPDETNPGVTAPTETDTNDPTEPDTTEPSVKIAFVDVAEDAYYTSPVLWAVDNGITTGMSETTFVPDGTCTRAQIVTFLWRAHGSPAPASDSNPFTDVPAGQWYTDAVLWAVEQGITTGTSATTFSPDAGCTRGQVATFLWRAQGEPAPGGENIFTDLTGGAYYYNAVLWAVENGITNGMGDGIFAPDQTCTRGQIVTFLYRAIMMI